jgi:hypothetical protein
MEESQVPVWTESLATFIFKPEEALKIFNFVCKSNEKKKILYNLKECAS